MRAQTLKTLRFLPIIGIGLIFAAFFYYHAYDYFTFHSLKAHHHLLQHWVNANYALSVLSFIGVYCVATTCAAPWTNIFTFSGGFLFGFYLGGFYSLVGAMLGAILLFLSVRYALGDWLSRRGGKKIMRIQQEFQHHSSLYLLILRFIPVVPFSLVNIVAALAEVPLRIFIITTFFGMIPETLLYALLGHNLSRLTSSDEVSPTSFFSLSIFLPIAGLFLLMLLAIIYQQHKRRSPPADARPV